MVKLIRVCRNFDGLEKREFVEVCIKNEKTYFCTNVLFTKNTNKIGKRTKKMIKKKNNHFEDMAKLTDKLEQGSAK